MNYLHVYERTTKKTCEQSMWEHTTWEHRHTVKRSVGSVMKTFWQHSHIEHPTAQLKEAAKFGNKDRRSLQAFSDMHTGV